MYVNVNGILAAQRPGRRAGRGPGRGPGGVRDLARAGLGPAPWPGRVRAPVASWQGFPGPPGNGAETPGPLWLPGVVLARPGLPGAAGCSVAGRAPGDGRGTESLGRRFILRSLGMIRSIVTGFSRIYEGRSCGGGPA
jgi:hypothetical protein